MLEKPNLPDAKIAECLCERYELTATALGFLPIGYDASAWVYRATASDGQRYFLKLRRERFIAEALPWRAILGRTAPGDVVEEAHEAGRMAWVE